MKHVRIIARYFLLLDTYIFTFSNIFSSITFALLYMFFKANEAKDTHASVLFVNHE